MINWYMQRGLVTIPATALLVGGLLIMSWLGASALAQGVFAGCVLALAGVLIAAFGDRSGN